MCVCVCVCVCEKGEGEKREIERDVIFYKTKIHTKTTPFPGLHNMSLIAVHNSCASFL